MEVRFLSYIFATTKIVIDHKMKKNSIPKPTSAELEVLSILWKKGPSTVRVICDEINKKRKVVYTTALKTMQNMYDKGMLKREEQGRSHIYESILNENETQNVLLNNFVDTAFGGSAVKLVMKALGSCKASRSELDKIKELIKLQEDK